ncbi:MAG: exosortase/archaeosortase family protein [Verrucomicrobiae bacterium]|nr:exosortase/archaeosortase family protein [Verrucomicrobiae bacterium]
MVGQLTNKRIWWVGASAIGVLGYMFFVQPYATGYWLERSTLWSDMQHGYQADGAEWSFGYFVPFAVILVIWLTRHQFAKLDVEPSVFLGLGTLFLGFFIYFAGYKANEKYIGFAAGQILVAGVVLWFLGWRWFKQGFWIWILLALVWPLRFLIEPVSFPLQMIMVKLTAGFLNVVGDPALANGTAILSAPMEGRELGERFSLNVAAACSGLRSLFALFMIALLYGYLALKNGWHRLLLVLSVPFMAIMGNFVRMVLLYFGVLSLGPEMAIGKGEHDPSTYHLMAGFAVFAVSLAGMTLLVQFMKRGRRSSSKRLVIVKQATFDEH